MAWNPSTIPVPRYNPQSVTGPMNQFQLRPFSPNAALPMASAASRGSLGQFVGDINLAGGQQAALRNNLGATTAQGTQNLSNLRNILGLLQGSNRLAAGDYNQSLTNRLGTVGLFRQMLGML